jgi:hypothetical protein
MKDCIGKLSLSAILAGAGCPSIFRRSDLDWKNGTLKLFRTGNLTLPFSNIR